MIKGLILSIQFFTRIPINVAIDFNKKNIKYSVCFMPLVGAIIGGLGGLVYYLIEPYNKLIASFFALLITICLTGGLHIDGLSDTFDGFLANKDNKEETLRIMEDSRIGTFGVLAIVIQLTFKLIMIMGILHLPLAILLSFANSRLVAGITLSFKKAAKTSGLGALFHNSNPKKLIIISAFIYSIILVSIDIKYIIPLIINYILAEYISYVSYRKIGGLTGDVIGTIIELGETISLLSFWGIMIWI